MERTLKSFALWLVIALSTVAVTGAAAADRFALDRLDQPALPLLLDDGKTLADYGGRWVLLHFWATWCGPCVKEMRDLDRLNRRWSGKVAIFTVSIDEDGELSVPPFLREHGIEMTTLLARDAHASDRYWSRGVPVTYIIDPRGRLVARALGTREWDTEAADRTLSALTGITP
jgi:thiol-disulfide isomerase/thioredoxin